MAPGDVNMYLTAAFAFIAGPWLIVDPIGYLNANKGVLGVFERLLNIPAPPYNHTLAAASGQLGAYQFAGTLVIGLGTYYLLAQLAGDEYYKRSTVWGRIAFGIINVVWALQKNTTSNSFFLFIGFFDILMALWLGSSVGFQGGVAHARRERSLGRKAR